MKETFLLSGSPLTFDQVPECRILRKQEKGILEETID